MKEYPEWIRAVKVLIANPDLMEFEEEMFAILFKDGWSVEKAADAYHERVST